MKRTFLLCSLSLTIGLSAPHVYASASETDAKTGDKFSNIDSMINGLELASNGGTPSPAAEDVKSDKKTSTVQPSIVREVPADTLNLQQPLPTLPADVSQPNTESVKQVEPASVVTSVKAQSRSAPPTLSERVAAEEAARDAASKKSGETRVSDLPPYSRFDFVRDLFIPANKKGVLFVDGKPLLGVESTADPVRVMMERPATERVCALISDKNYVMMRGASATAGSERSYLELASVSFMEWSPAAGTPGVFVNLRFAPKPAKGVDGKDVNISLQCRIPSSIAVRMNETTLNQVNEGFGGLFSFQLPQIIEI